MQVNKILTGFVFVGVRISMRNSMGGWLHTNLLFYYVISAELSVFHAVCEYIDA
jgi:hypothetical protein